MIFYSHGEARLHVWSGLYQPVNGADMIQGFVLGPLPGLRSSPALLGRGYVGSWLSPLLTHYRVSRLPLPENGLPKTAV
jgi:hypothetical protein